MDTSLSPYKSQSRVQFCDQEKPGTSAAEQAAIILFPISLDASNITGAT
jgi:hypothetical protein